MELTRKKNLREIKLTNGLPDFTDLPSNRVCTSKHSLRGFLLSNLVEQFTRLSTVWFTFITVVAFNPFRLDYSSSPLPLALLLVHLCTSIAQDGLAAYRGHLTDRKLNKEKFRVWTGLDFQALPCEDIKVGHVVLVSEKDRIPVDLILLATSAEDGNCYINTSSIFGENNLEVKTAVKELHRTLPDRDTPPSFNFHRLTAVVSVDPPSPDYSSFSGKLKIKNYPRAAILGLSNFVLRSSILSGTDWILGVTVYTGMETKVWINTASTPRKTSGFTRRLNFWILYAALVVLLISGLLLLIQQFVSIESVTGEDFLLYVLALYSEIPIALYIALDLVRGVLTRRLGRHNGGTVFKAETMSEDLAKVNFVLADKTGTLTENDLELVQIQIDGQVYTKSENQSQLTALENSNRIEMRQLSRSSRHSEEQTFADLKQDMQDGVEPFKSLCESLALCNSVIPVGLDSYKATSSDEMALVLAARELGCCFHTRVNDICGVEIFDSCYSYHVIGLRKFIPELRRMRVLIQSEFEDYATIYVKGAYAVLKDFLKLSPLERLQLEDRLEEMAKKGLRTMVLCYRKIEGEQLAEVKQQAEKAKLAKANVEGKMELLLKSLERDLMYLGTIGMRDKVRPETKECMQTLRQAGIETWILSGDSESNTMACAYSLDFIEPDTKVVSLRGIYTTEHCIRKMMNIAKVHIFHREPVETPAVLPPESPRSHMKAAGLLDWTDYDPDSVNYALSIDNITLATALKEHVTRRLLMCLLYASSFTCFNSLHPSHKREITRLLREGLSVSPIVLAIGDDSSNIPMILEADIGIGVISKSNNRTANSSEIAIPHFSFLAKLLLDSKENSMLLSQTALLYIYSATVLELIKITFMLVADVTAAGLFSMDLTVLYNTVFTFVPIVCAGVKNRLSPDQRIPEAYSRRSHITFSFRNTGYYLLLALVHYILLTSLILPACFVGEATICSGEELNVTFILAVTAAVNQHCYQEIRYGKVEFVCCSVISLGAAVLYYGVATPTQDLYGALEMVATTPRLVLSVLFPPIACRVASVVFTHVTFAKDNQSFSTKISPIESQSSFVKNLKRDSRTIMDIYQGNNIAPASHSDDSSNFEISGKKVQFCNRSTENSYVLDFITTNLRLIRLTIMFYVFQLLIPLIAVYGDLSLLPYLVIACGAAFSLFLSTSFHWKVTAVVQWFACIFIVITFIVDAVDQHVHELVYFSIPVGLLLILKEQWLYSSLVVLAAFLLLCADIILESVCQNSISLTSNVIHGIGIVAVQTLVSLISVKVSYHSDYQARLQYKMLKETEDKVAQSESILGCLLPDFVRKRVKDGLRYISEDKASVSVLFCEICDFDTICTAYSPSDLTELLDDIFQRIDELCATMGVAKIETVGKVYMACTGLSDFESEVSNDVQLIPPERRALELAFAILSSFHMYKLQTGNTLKLKIGVNTGPVIAGVVGYHKPQFSLVGDTVNTASRMCSTIDTPDTIQISASTYHALDPASTPDFRKRTVTAKGKGELLAYSIKEADFNEVSRSRRRTNTDFSDETTPDFSKARTLRKRSIGVALRQSLDFEEVVIKNDKELIEKVVILPFGWLESRSEKQFRVNVAERKLNRMKLGLNAYLVAFSVLAIVKFLQIYLNGSAEYAAAGSILSVCVAGAGFIRLRLTTIYMRRVFPWLLLCVYTLTTLAVGLDFVLGLDFPTDLSNLIFCFVLTLLYYCSGLFFRHALFGSVFLILPWSVVWLALGFDSWERPVFMFLFGAQHCIHMYFNEKNQRTFFNLSKLAAREIEKTERLLTQMLPVHAYEGLKHEEWVTDRLLKVTLLYADISGFTAWASINSPQEVINRLGTIYTAFDKICVRLGMYKVHTIGDCYVAMSATNNSEARDPAYECRSMMRFGMEMVKVLEDQHDGGPRKLSMRIGLHIGDVVGGIIGSKVVRYDIYGADVMIANKMESNGVEGRLNVSEDVKMMMEEQSPGMFRFVPNKLVEVQDVNRTVQCFFATPVD